MLRGVPRQTLRWRKGKAYLLVIGAYEEVVVAAPVLRIVRPDGATQDLALTRRTPTPAPLPDLVTDPSRNEPQLPTEPSHRPDPERWKIRGLQAIDPRRRVTFDIEPTAVDVEVIEATLGLTLQKQTPVTPQRATPRAAQLHQDPIQLAQPRRTCRSGLKVIVHP